MIEIHASTLPSYPDCPRRAATRILRRLIQDQGYVLRSRETHISSAIGNGTHDAAKYLAAIKQSGKVIGEPEFDQAINIGIETLRAKSESGAIFDATTANKNDAEHQVRTLSKSFQYEVLPKIVPVTIEPPEMRCTIIENEIEFVGHWDLEQVQGLDDWKTTQRMHASQAQMGGYSLLRQGRAGSKPGNLTIWHLPRTSLKKNYPGAQRHDYPVDISEFSAFTTIKHIVSDVRKFLGVKEPWVFLCNPRSMLCSPKYCSAYGTDFCELTKGLSGESKKEN